jgi:hypothetical protein
MDLMMSIYFGYLPVISLDVPEERLLGTIAIILQGIISIKC